MQKVTMNLLPKQAEELAYQILERLTLSAKLRLAKKLERETRQARWEPIVAKLRQRFAQRSFSVQEIRRLCEKVRQERASRADRR